MKRLLLALLILSSSSFASTGGLDGNELLRKCKPWFDDIAGIEHPALTNTERLDKGFCAGYIGGVVDVEGWWVELEGKTTKTVHYCFPKDGVKSGQILRILKKWLDANPEKLHWTADMIIRAAMIEAFPCD